jgi:S1-C subfamily serine protease
MRRSVVVIKRIDVVKKIGGTGSGTIIKRRNNTYYILTCAHVVGSEIIREKTAMIFVNFTTQFGQEKSYPAKVIKYDASLDLAVIKVNMKEHGLLVASISRKRPKLGDVAYSMGNPMGIERVLSKGLISSLLFKGYYMFDGVITSGNSGGALFNSKGELIGVPSQGPNYSVGITEGVPESNLGMSIDLPTLTKFIRGI